jgi:ATP-binding cassette, subfamily B, bacterial
MLFYFRIGKTRSNLKVHDNYKPNSLFYTFSKIRYFIFTKEKKKVFALIFILILAGAIPSIDGILLQKLTDFIESFSDQNASDLSLPYNIFKWVLTYVIWWESLNILWRSYDYIYMKTLPKIKATVIDEFYNYIQHHGHDFFQNHLAGDISSRITDGSRALEMIYSYLHEKMLRKFAVIVFAFITIYSVHYTIAYVFLLWIVLFIGISLYFARKINDYATIYGRNRALVSGKIVDNFANISAVRMFSSQCFERSYLKKYLNQTVTSDQNMQWFLLKLRYFLGIFCSIMIGLVVYCIFSLRSQLAISTGECVLIITICLAIIDDFWDLTQEFGDMFEQIGFFATVMSFLDRHQVTDINDAATLTVKKGEIEFKDVTFFYHHNNNIFNNKSVVIKSGQKVGLAGFSGSGKTTFTNLITRLFDVDKGHILIDDQDIKDVTQESLRRNISIIPQEPILFHRTIMENIRYGKKDATDEEVKKAAKAAYIDELIESLPDGYQTLCGERGNSLSGGQKQRIIIARAILKNSPILILDEATSALDTYTENLIQKSLNTLMKGKTVLVIAHRLSTLLNMDRILVFDNGCIVEDGSHQELKNNGKVYQLLWDTQASGTIDKPLTTSLNSK